MLPEIIPIISPMIDWQKYLINCRQILGRSITNQVDNFNIPSNTLEAFLISLANVRSPGLKPNEILTQPSSILAYVQFGFLIIIDEDTYALLREHSAITYFSEPSLVKNVKLVIASGTLSQWLQAIMHFCSPIVSFELRLFSDKLILYFESIGLGKLFLNYKRKSLEDTTFILEAK